MDVRAILLIGVRQPGTESSGAATETLLGMPIASLDVLGKPLVHHVAGQLLAAGVSGVTILADSNASLSAAVKQPCPGITFTSAPGPGLWRECENIFQDVTGGDGAEVVIVWRMGPYAELDVEALSQFHLDQHSHVTQVCDRDGNEMGISVVSGSRRNDAAYLFRHGLSESRLPGCNYEYAGVLNWLRNAADLRQLTLDSLSLRTALQPPGEQVRPGVWLGKGARVQRGARLLAPCFVGEQARVRAAAVVTRGSAVEHHSEVDCGTVIEASSVLPYSYVGAGLDVSHSIVGFRKLAPLRRAVEVEVTDPKLIGMASEHAPIRALGSLAALVSFLPRQVFRGFSHKTGQCEAAPGLAAPVSPAVVQPHALRGKAIKDPENIPPNMMVARRYGNE